MSLPKFDYQAPETIDEAVLLLSEAKKDAKVIAGGTDLVVAMKQRRITPALVVNIKGIKGLEYIKNGKGDVRIGALTPLSSIEESKLIKERFPGLAKAAGAVGAPSTEMPEPLAATFA